jgi:hypothetical protein
MVLPRVKVTDLPKANTELLLRASITLLNNRYVLILVNVRIRY